MRVLPISGLNTGRIHAGEHQKKVYSEKPMSEPKLTGNDVSFHGVKAGIGATLGTIAGAGLGVLLTIGTGGLAAPLILGCVGCAAGGIACSDDEKHENDMGGHDYDDNGHSHYD